MKKITNILVLLIGLSFSINNINAQVTLSQSVLLITKMDSVYYDTIRATGFNNIGAFGFEIDWDSTKLQYISTNEWNAKVTAMGGSPLVNSPDGGTWIAAWVVSGTKGLNLGNAIICIIKFKYIKNDCVILNWNSDNTDVSDNNLNLIPIILDNGSISYPPPIITKQPKENIVCENSNISFKVSANSIVPLSFKWLVSKNGCVDYSVLTDTSIYSNVTDSILIINPTSFSMNGYLYKCIVSNCGGSVTSEFAILKVKKSPLVNITPVGTIIQFNPVSLTANTPDTVTYQWQSASVNINGATNSALNVLVSGNYSVVVTDKISHCSNTSIPVQVNIAPLVIDSIIAHPAIICAGNPSTLTIYPESKSNVFKYLWSTGDTTQSVIVSPIKTMSYKVTVTSDTSKVMDSIKVSVFTQLATATPQGVTSFCTGDSVKIIANTGAGLTYHWQNSGVNINGATLSYYTASLPGIYEVVVSQNSCSSTSNPTTVTINSYPTAIITPVGSTTFCNGSNVVLNTNTGSGLSYQWQNSGYNINGATLPSYIATSTGNYTVIVTQNSCLTTSNSTTVTVNSYPLATATPQGLTSFCLGDSVKIVANTGTGFTYQWQKSGSVISGATASYFNAKSGGNYSVIVTQNACSGTSSLVTIVTYFSPVANASANGSTNFCKGNSVVLIADTGTGLNYQWQNSGININGATLSFYTATSTGNYTVIVSQTGCINNATSSPAIIVTVGNSDCSGMVISLPNIIAKNGDTIKVPITVSLTSNVDIGAFGLGLRWDSTKLQLVDLYKIVWNSNFLVFKFSPLVNFDTIINADSLYSGGTFKSAWYSNGTRGASITNGATIATLFFKYIGASGCVPLIWDTSFNVMGDFYCNYIPVTYLNGSICNLLPDIISQPSSVIVCDSSSVFFNVTASSLFPLSYQWLLSKDGGLTYSALTNVAPYSNVNDSILNINPALIAMDSSMYKCIVSNIYGSDTSTAAMLNVKKIKELNITYSGNTTLCNGDSLKLNTVDCSGFTYQWQNNFSDIAGATNDSYIAKASGNYTVIVTKHSSSFTSSAVSLVFNECSHINGICYFDKNSNCIYDNNDSILRNVRVMLYKDNHLYDITYTDRFGNYSFMVILPGNYFIKADSLPVKSFSISCTSTTIPVSAFPSVINISYKCNESLNNEISSSVWGAYFAPRPNHNAAIDLDFYNNTCFVFDINVKAACTTKNYSFAQINNNGVIDGDTARWDFQNTDNAFKFYNTMSLQPGTTLKAGDSVCFYIKLIPSNNPTVNGSTILRPCYIARSSWGPNGKEVTPMYLDNIDIYPDSTLNYTIYFENTGNANAQNIVITDVLDNNLDITTLRLVSSSSPVSISVSNNGTNYVLTFTFANINLPYESSDSTLSYGYVKYSINPIKGLIDGTKITNTADIVFDNNSAIPTNTLQNYITTFVGISDTKLKYSIVEIFPNPVTNELYVRFTNINAGVCYISVLDVTGKIIKCLNSSLTTGLVKINICDLSGGLYILKIQTNGNAIIQYSKLIKL